MILVMSYELVYSYLVLLTMKVYTYAILKDYFDKEFIVDEQASTIESLNTLLIQKNPAAATILSACRYAVKDNFVTDDFVLTTEDSIHIIPPSSGG
jgi:sulfur-carrier protein